MRSKVTMFYIASTSSAIFVNVLMFFIKDYKNFLLLIFAMYLIILYSLTNLTETPFFCH